MTPRPKIAEPKPVRSGFCNLSWSLDTPDGRASHARCSGYRCPCICHQPDPDVRDASDQAENHATPQVRGVVRAPPDDPLPGLTITQAVDLFLAAAEHLDTAASYEAVRVLDHETILRLLDRLRAATRIAGDLDRTLTGAAYAKGRGDHIIDGIGLVTVSRTTDRKGWDERGIAQGVIDAKMAQHHADGTMPDPWEVIDWFLEVCHVDYARLGALRALGLDPDAYSDAIPGRPQVRLPARG